MFGSPLSRMKRKDVDDARDEFSELLLSAPARKIRRLDAEHPLPMEGMGWGTHSRFEPENDVNLLLSQEPGFPSAMEEGDRGVHMEQADSLASEMCVNPPANEERALVLYKPVDPQFLVNPARSHVSLNVSPGFIAGFGGQSMFWQWNSDVISAMEEPTMNENSTSGNNPLALIPWVPHGTAAASRINSVEERGEEVETTTMEVEDESGRASESLQQWQQHCMTPWLSASSPSPILWST